MKKLIRQFTLLSFASVIYTTTALSADIFKADRNFTEKQYQLAKKGYEEAAKIGNPHAYYQLGIMYQRGLGVEKDPLNALIYIAMAAEYQLQRAQQAYDKMLAPMNEQQRQVVNSVIEQHKKTDGKEAIQQNYFPQLATENLTETFTFDGETFIDREFFSEDFDPDNNVTEFEDEISYDENGDEEDGDTFNLIMTTPRKPFLILDHDIAKDGSKRNISDVQKMGNSLTLKDEYSLFPAPLPTFKEQPAEFVHRAYLGAATYSKFTMVKEDERLYSNILRSVRKMKNSSELSEQYQYAMALQNFTWLEQEEGEVEKRLLDLSKQGHPGAMFEYGLKLYREQRNIEEAIFWIGQASTYGLARAEYRLGKLFTSSPWVQYDEKKALFWFESAVKKDHVPATLKTIELKLTANDKSLHDLDTAIALLDKIQEKQGNNPEFYYLLALSHKNRENRDYTKVISNLEKAIFMAQLKNWNTDEWRDLLTLLTQGNVYIVE